MTLDIILPMTISSSPFHQVIFGSGRAPKASHLNSVGCPADNDWLTPKRRTDVGPTRIGYWVVYKLSNDWVLHVMSNLTDVETGTDKLLFAA